MAIVDSIAEEYQQRRAPKCKRTSVILGPPVCTNGKCILFLNSAKLSLPSSHVQVYIKNAICPFVVIHDCICPQCQTYVHSTENAARRACTTWSRQAFAGQQTRSTASSTAAVRGPRIARQPCSESRARVESQY